MAPRTTSSPNDVLTPAERVGLAARLRNILAANVQSKEEIEFIDPNDGRLPQLQETVDRQTASLDEFTKDFTDEQRTVYEENQTVSGPVGIAR
jgi:hypothetical protein